MNSVYAAADEKKATVLAGLDFSAAFDDINHDLQCAFGVPQVSVLGPLLFTVYASPVGELVESHGVSSSVC